MNPRPRRPIVTADDPFPACPVCGAIDTAEPGGTQLCTTKTGRDHRARVQAERDWQAVAGPHVDLVREAATYLARHGGRPADDPHAAWQGWLRAARRRADEQHRPPIGCPRCHDGWLEDDERGRPRPCTTCRPRHLAAVEDAS